VAVWNFDTGSEGWGDQQNCLLAVAGGALRIQSEQLDPQVGVTVGAPAGPTELRLRVNAGRRSGAQLFWATENERDFSEDRSVVFEVIPGDTGWQNLSMRFEPKSRLTRLRLDPDLNEGRPVDWTIDSIALLHMDSSD
jgi:hypothetical protein